jgi:protein O-GlcNAc transferase
LPGVLDPWLLVFGVAIFSDSFLKAGKTIMTHGSIDQAMQLAIQHHQAGRLPQAEQIYREVLTRQPNHDMALHLLGAITAQAGQLDTAIELLRRAIEAKPASAMYHNNLGYMLRNRGSFDEAIAACRQAILLQPNYAEAYNNLGNALRDKGDLDEAIAACRHALKLKPDFAEAYNNLGNALRDKRQLDDAIAAYRQAARFKPNLAEAHGNLANTLLDKGMPDEAILSYRQALRLKPDDAKFYNNLGRALCDKGQLDEAGANCRHALKLKPDFAAAYNNLAVILKDMGQIDEAISACRQAVALQPDSELFHSNLLLILHYYEEFDPQTILAESLLWGIRHADPLNHLITPHTNDRSPDRRLRIGYISADFREHPVCRFFLPLLAAHDHAQVEIFCYANVARPDAITQRIRGLAHQWRDIAALTDQQVADQIRADEIDILIDLAGHTGGNRLLVFARKPAPIQVTWLGYPDTTGVAAMDYRLTDALADPPGVSEALANEELIRLSPTAWCYQGPDENLPLDDTQVDSTTPVIFGSFNNFSKVTRPMLELWAEILRATPNSRLFIKAKALGCSAVQQRARQILQACGIASDRVDLHGWRNSCEDHLASYRQMHIALDTFPYHGTTTTCEALWMGVPVVTLAGTMHMSRVGVSMLSNIGLQELIAESPQQYVQIAVELAKDRDRLNKLRRNLRERLQRSPLMDNTRFAASVEAAYRLMWGNWCARSLERQGHGK